MTFKDLYCFSGTFQAWNFIFQIQGLSRISQDRGYPVFREKLVQFKEIIPSSGKVEEIFLGIMGEGSTQ